MSVTTARRAGEQSVTAYQNLIGGEWQHASDSRTLDMISPSDGQAFARIARGTKADVDAAVKAARHAFEEGMWGKLTAVERGRQISRRHHPVPRRLHGDHFARAQGRHRPHHPGIDFLSFTGSP